MKCPKCQFENREGARFCNECGHRFGIVCPECGANNRVGSKFCDECGHNLEAPKEAPPIDFNQPRSYTPKFLAEKILTNRSAMEGERKQVTVLFADVANYTSISEKIDPEEVHQIMDGCFKILMDEIHKYEGTINQFTGDGVMALFGAPVAHENHAQRACYAALSIQKGIQEYGKKVKEDCGVDFLMRIGLNSGPVIVGSIGDDLRMDYTAVGDTTNLASRVENMAKPGTILGTIYTHRLARDYFEFERLAKVQVKGKKEPVEAYQLIRPSEIETRIEAAAAKGLTEFVGRKKEMEILKEAFKKACYGFGQVVGIVGEAGVGKSRLLLELKGILPKDEYTYLEGRCLHYGSSMPYLPISDILRGYFEIIEGDRVFVINKKLEEKILQLDERLKSILPPIQELLSLKVEDSAYLQLEPQQKRQRCFEAIRDVLVRESERQPLVLVVDDLHWIDRSSEEFLGYFVDWLANAKVLLIFLYRPEYTHAWGSKSYYSKIGVDQLSTKSSAKLVQNILEGGEVVPELRELIIDRAGGNPLFVEELTHSLLENGSIQRKDHQYVLARQASEIEVPDTIQGIIAARIDHVEESLKRIVQVASVIGREFAYRILQTIMGMREELKSSLLNLQGLEFIYEKRLFPELEYIFKHALTQEVAYNSLLIKRRKEIHEKIGNAIEDLYPDRLEEYYEMLAHHYVLSNNREKALDYLVRANQKAARVNALQEAMSYFDKAMEILDSLPETESNQQRRISLLVGQWDVFQLLLRFSEYYDLLNQYKVMVTKLGNQKLLGMFYARIGACEWWFAHLDQAIKTLTDAVELCEGAGAHEDLGSAYCPLQWSHLWKGDFTQVLTLKETAIRLMEKHFKLRPYVLVLTGASWAYSHTGSWDNAVKEAEKGLKVAEEYSNNSLISFAAFAMSVAYTLRGDLSNALEYGEQAVQVAPTPADKVWAQSGLAWALCRLGDPHKGIELATNLASMYHAVRFSPAEIYTIITLGEGHWRCGDNGAATQRLHEGLELAERTGMRFLIAYACRLLGETISKVNPEQALNHFMRSIAIFQEVKAENELALAYSGFGRLQKGQGNREQARKNLTNALEIFEKLGTLGEPDKVRQELAQLDQGSDK